MEWKLKKFNELTVDELYAVLQLRNEVFVVEQNCVFQDADEKDQASFHLMGWHGEKLAAYSRLVPPGKSFDKASIGRVVTASWIRGKGAGKELMKISIEKTKQLFGDGAIMVSAQLYLKEFYKSLGFQPCSDVYLEDGIDHIKMSLP